MRNNEFVRRKHWKNSRELYWKMRKRKKAEFIMNSAFCRCGRWDLNPHDRIDHKILSLARLPIPTLPQMLLLSATNNMILLFLQNVNILDEKILEIWEKMRWERILALFLARISIIMVRMTEGMSK